MISAFESSTATPEIEADRRRALRALLRYPMLTATGETSEDYIRVRRHSEWLKDWLAKFPAWGLHIDKEVVRLRKIPPDLQDDTRPAIDRVSGTSFSRRRYALLCLVLAALEEADAQTTIGQIAVKIMQFVHADRDLQAAGMILDIENYDQRRDLVHAIRFLIDAGVMHRIDGDERQFLNRNGSVDVLYNVNRHGLAAILNVLRSPSAVATETDPLSRLLDDATATHGDRIHKIRARLVRALLDDPILYFHDLDEEERIYLDQHRGHLLRQIHEATGLIAEVRQEGIAMLDDGGDLTDLKLPEDSTEGRVALSLARWLAEFFRNCPDAVIPTVMIEEQVRKIGEEVHLIEDVLLRLRSLRLIQLTAEGVVPLAACGRYAHKRTQETGLVDCEVGLNQE